MTSTAPVVNTSAPAVRTRSRRWRALVLVPVAGLALTVLSACTSKAGLAATVGGSRITEQRLTDLTGTNPQPISDSSGNQIPARSFVLQTIVESDVISKALDAVGRDTSPGSLDKYHNQALQDTSEGEIRGQIAKLGLGAGFYDVLINQVEMELAAQSLSSDARFEAALKKYANTVSVAQRYGTWDGSKGQLSQLSSKDVPSFLSYSTSLPGDSAAG